MSAPTKDGNTATNAEAFAAWATVHEHQQNPLLKLEERYLSRILPDTAGRCIMDIGCGTGRWLTHFARTGVASLCGVDSSAEMLDVAADKQLANVRLVRAELPCIPVDSNSMDLAIASFVLSYVKELEKCASELGRIVRAGGDLFISDMHPDTLATLGWRRSFSSAGRSYQLAFENRQIAEVIETFALQGFLLTGHMEPCFGLPERELFRTSGKDAAWGEVDGWAPIYLLHFRRLPYRVDGTSMFSMHGAQCALGPGERLAASISIRDGVINSILSEPPAAVCRVEQETQDLDLHGYLVFPGLINAHDHLEFSLFPRLGFGSYDNAAEWARDIQIRDAETIALHKKVPKAVRLWWGGIRNLLCGVTSVSHHNPLDPLLISSEFPVRVVRKYGWEHSLAFGKDISAALRETPCSEPFLIHAGEGTDADAFAELRTLNAMGALDSRTVLVHGLAMDEAGTTLLNERGSALVICPSSNFFLFQKNHMPDQLQAIDRLALGSDSPITAEGDLLDEIRFAYRVCEVPAERLYGMVTDRAAQILRLGQGEGTLRIGSPADLIAIRSRPGNPCELLSKLNWRDVELVTVGGEVRLASEEIILRLPPTMARGLTAVKIEDQLRWLRAPILSLLQSAETVLGAGNVRVGGVQVRNVDFE